MCISLRFSKVYSLGGTQTFCTGMGGAGHKGRLYCLCPPIRTADVSELLMERANRGWLARMFTIRHTGVFRSWLQLRSLRLLALLKTRSPMVRSPMVTTERPAASAAIWRALRPSLRSAWRAVWLVARSNSHWARWRPTMEGWAMVMRATATATTVGMLVRVRRSDIVCWGWWGLLLPP